MIDENRSIITLCSLFHNFVFHVKLYRENTLKMMRHGTLEIVATLKLWKLWLKLVPSIANSQNII